MSTTTLTIRNEAAFAASIKSLARRAKKLGIAAPTYVVLGRRMEEQNIRVLTDDGHLIREERRNIEVADVEVSGPTVKLDGWEFAAKLVPAGPANVFVGPLADVLPESFRHSGTHCAHCNQKRLRAHTFALRHEGGEIKQVGSTCIHDFLGNASAANVAGAFEFAATLHQWLHDWEDSEERSGSVGTAPAYPVAVVVAHAMSLGKYISRDRAEELGVQSTADQVRDMLQTRWVGEAEVEAAEALIAEALETIEDDGGSYVQNLRHTLAAGYCVRATVGIAASVVAAVARARKRKVEQEAAAASQHVGTVGERRSFRGTVANRFGYATNFGWVDKVVLIDDNGNHLVANNLPGEIGQVVELKATVKEHNEFRGTKQTLLARPHKPTVVA